MADDIEVLVTELRVDMKRYEAAMRRQARITEQAADKVERRYRTMNKRVVQSSNEMSRDVRRAIAALALGVGAREVTRYADSWVDLNNRLRSSSQISGVQSRGLLEIRESAKLARSEIEPYVNLYSRLLRVSGKVGATEMDVSRATDIVTKSFKAGGAASSEQAAGVMQLGQALNGILGGDELRSVRENAPLLFEGIAKGLGVTSDKLKEMGAAGELTGKRVFEAILKSGDDIDAAFAVTIPRASDAAVLAFDNLKLKVGEYLQEGGQVQGVSNVMATAIDFVADNVDAFADALVVGGAALTGALGAQAAVMAVTTLNGIATGATTAAKAMTLLRVTSAFLLGPAGLIIGVAALSAGVAYLAINASKVDRPVSKARDRLSEMKTEMDAIAALLPEPFDGAATGAETLADKLDPLPQKFRDLKKAMEESGAAGRQIAIDDISASMIELQNEIGNTEARIGQLTELASVRPSLGGMGAGLIATDAAEQLKDEKALLAEQTAELEAQAKLRKRVLGADNSAFKPTGTTTTTDGTGSQKNAVDEVGEAYRKMFESQREEAARVYQEQLAGIAATKDSVEEKAKAEQQALAIYQAKMAEIRAQDESDFNDYVDREAEKIKIAEDKAATEQSIIDDIMNRRDEMAGRALAIIDREYDARRAAIENEMADGRRKEEALAGLDAERSERLAKYKEEILGLGEYSDNQVDQVRATEAAKLAALEEWHQANLDAVQEYEDRKAEIVQEAEDKVAQIRAIALSNSLSNAADLFGNMSDVVKAFAGEQSGIYKAMFAVSKAFAIADSIVKIQQGIGNALSLPFPANIAAAGVVAGQGATVIASIQQTAANFRDGGVDIRGPGTGRSDSIPAMISNGESVITAAGTAANRGILAAINAGVNVESALGSMRGASSVSIGPTQLFVSGDIGTQETLAALMVDLDRRDANLERSVLAIVKRDRAKTIPRHRL